MAKNEKIILDNHNERFDFDDDWGNNFDAPKENSGSNRDPVKKAGKTMLRKMGETTFTTTMAEKLLKSAMPPSFTVAWNNVDNALTDTRQLYRDVSKNASPVVREMKSLGRNLNRLLPTRFSNKINALLQNQGGSAAALGQMNMEDLTVARGLQDIFGAAPGQSSQDREQSKNELIKTLTDQEYRVKLGSAITNIQDLLNRQTTYNFTVQRSFQRKSMEIQIRQLMVQRAQLDVSQKSALETSNLLRVIVENSALPNEVKVQRSEEFKKMLRQRVYGDIQNRLSAWTANYRESIGKRVRQKSQDMFSALSTGIGLGNDVVEQSLMQREMAEMQGIDPMEWASGAAGVQGALLLGGKIGKSIRKRFPQLNKANNPLQRFNYFFNNKERLASDWANKGYDYGKWYNPATNILKDVLRGGYSDQGTIRAGGMKGLESGSMDMDSRKLRALEEIIPGYLSRILHSIDIMRTGDEKTERTVFNTQRGTFTTMSQSRSDVRNNLLSQKEIDTQRNNISNLIGQIDPNNKLTPEARERVVTYMFNRSRTSKAFNPTTLANTKVPGLSNDDNKVWQGLLATRYGLTLNDQMRWEGSFLKGNNVNLNRDAGDYNFTSSQTVGLFNRAHALTHSGNIEQLIQEGAVTWKDGNWVLNKDYYANRVNGNETGPTEESGQGSTSKNNPFKGGPRGPLNHPLGNLGGNGYDLGGYHGHLNLGDVGYQRFPLGKGKGPDLSVIIGEQVDRLLENLTPYQQHQEEGLQRLVAEVQSLRSSMGNGAGVGGNSGEGGDDIPTNPRSRWGKRYDSFKRLARLGGKGLKGYWNVTGLPFKVAGLLGRHISSPLFNTALGSLRTGKNFLFNKISDGYIYTNEGLKKVIDREGLKAGRYIDQKTGEIISKLSDIKGAVWDKFEQTQVLSDDEAKEGLLDKTGKVIKNKATKILQTLGKAALGIAIPKVGVGAIAGRALGFARRLFDKIPDVYVPGENTPRLFASKIAKGDYYQIATGKRVSKLSDIKGEIGTIDPVTKKITPVLTSEEISRGLVDRRGNPLRTGLGKALGMAGGLIRFGLSPVTGAMKTLRTVGNLAGNLVDGGLGLLGRMIPGRGRSSLSRKEQGWLPKIYRLLYNHFTGKSLEDEGDLASGAKNVFNRAKGKTTDFLKNLKGRSGSWVNRLLSFRKKKPEEEKRDHAEAKKSGLGGLLLSAVGGIGSILGGIGKGFGHFFKWIAGLPKWIAALKGGGLVEDAVEAAAGGRGKKGLLRRIGRGAWGLAKGAGKLALGAGAFLGRGLLSAGGLALRGAMVGGEAVAGAAGAVASAPVVVGAAIAAGLGYLIYKGWQAYSNRITDLRAYRVAAYGSDPKNKEEAGKLLALEEVILKKSKISDDGKLTVGVLNYSELLSGFDIPYTDQRAVMRWTRWYRFRFLPVFTKSVEVLYQRNKKAKITDANFLSPSQRPQYARDTFIPITGERSPYTISDSPFLNSTCIIGEKWPGLFRDKIINTYRKEEVAQPPLKNSLSDVPPVPKNTVSRSLAAVNKGGVGTFRLASATDSYYSPGDKGGPLGSITGNPSRDELYMMGNRIDDLSSIRVKLYGLTALTKENVNQLLSFERSLYPDVKRGSKGEMTYTKGTDETFNANFGHFGVNPNDPNEKAQWVYWFEHRFLPVYLNFLAQTKKLSPNLSPFNAWQKLTSSDLLSVANAMNRATTSVNGKPLSVWVVSSSPWPNTKSGTDPSIINGNLDALRAMSKREVYSENEKIQNTISKETFNGKPLTKSVVGRKIADFQTDVMSLTANNNARGNITNPNASGAYAQHFQSYGTSYDVSGAGMDYVNDNVAHLGEGTGGKANDLPKSNGQGWEANKALIVAAAKMAGVDAGSLAAMIAQESSFNPMAGNGKSSAKGLGQFTDGTWKQMLPILVKKYGINPNTPATDPRANVLATAEYMKQNAQIIGNIGRPLTTTDIYMAHFLGPGAAKKLLDASPDTDIRQVLGSSYNSVAGANPTIFDGVRTTGDLMRSLGGYLMKNGGRYINEANDLANAKSSVTDSATAGGKASGSTPSSTPTTPPIPAGAKSKLPTGDVAKLALGPKSTTLTPPIPLPASDGNSLDAGRALNDTISTAQSRAVRTRQDTSQADTKTALDSGNSMNQALGIFRSMDGNLKSILGVLQGLAKNGTAKETPDAKGTESQSLLDGTRTKMPSLTGKNDQPRPFNTTLNTAKYK